MNERYPDEEYSYVNGVMRNKFNIQNAESLRRVEYQSTEHNMAEIQAQDFTIPTTQEKLNGTSINDVFAIHRYLFQDLYPWAGQLRHIDIVKPSIVNGKPHDHTFALRKQFPKHIAKLNKDMARLNKISDKNVATLSKHLAITINDLNEFHPFREGNGRTQKLFAQVVAYNHGHNLDISASKNAEQQYKDATITHDDKKLASLFESLILDGDNKLRNVTYPGPQTPNNLEP